MILLNSHKQVARFFHI